MKAITLCAKFPLVAAAVVGALAALSAPAHAISFSVTAGMANPTTGATNQGMYSDYYKNANFAKNVKTVDFNNGLAPTTGFAKYSFESGNSSVRADMWAPVGTKGEKNDSNYLAVFDGGKVTVDLASSLNYFGINWGAAHQDNTYTFLKSYKDANGATQYRELKSFKTADIELGVDKTTMKGYTQVGKDWIKTDASQPGFAVYSHLNPGTGDGALNANGSGGQGNAYVHFKAEKDDEVFDRIVISQIGGGGFESDNHSFLAGTKAFSTPPGTSVPEPGMLLGLAAMGGLAAARKRKGERA
jgi:hypothetical protein